MDGLVGYYQCVGGQPAIYLAYVEYASAAVVPYNFYLLLPVFPKVANRFCTRTEYAP